MWRLGARRALAMPEAGRKRTRVRGRTKGRRPAGTKSQHCHCTKSPLRTHSHPGPQPALSSSSRCIERLLRRPALHCADATCRRVARGRNQVNERLRWSLFLFSAQSLWQRGAFAPRRGRPARYNRRYKVIFGRNLYPNFLVPGNSICPDSIFDEICGMSILRRFVPVPRVSARRTRLRNPRHAHAADDPLPPDAPLPPCSAEHRRSLAHLPLDAPACLAEQTRCRR